VKIGDRFTGKRGQSVNLGIIFYRCHLYKGACVIKGIYLIFEMYPVFVLITGAWP
jgi:hypothetical protein